MKRGISCAAVLVLFAFSATVAQAGGKGGSGGSGSHSSGSHSGGGGYGGGMSGGHSPSYNPGIRIPIPQYYPQGQNYPQQQYQPYDGGYQDSTPRATAPPKNTIVEEIKDPPANKGLIELVKRGLLKIGSEETDAQQAFEPDKLGGLVDDEITKLIGRLGPAVVKARWSG